MSFRVTEMTVLFCRGEYREAADKIIDARRRAKTFSQTAKAFGVDYRTLIRWLTKLKQEGIDIRDEMGIAGVSRMRSHLSKIDLGEGRSRPATSEEQQAILLDAVRKHRGYIKSVARELGVSVQRVHFLIKKWNLYDAVEDIRFPINPAIIVPDKPKRKKKRTIKKQARVQPKSKPARVVIRSRAAMRAARHEKFLVASSDTMP